MARHGLNNIRVHKARVLRHFTEMGRHMLAISGSHLKWPNTSVQHKGCLLISFHRHLISTQGRGRRDFTTVTNRPLTTAHVHDDGRRNSKSTSATVTQSVRIDPPPSHKPTCWSPGPVQGTLTDTQTQIVPSVWSRPHPPLSLAYCTAASISFAYSAFCDA